MLACARTNGPALAPRKSCSRGISSNFKSPSESVFAYSKRHPATRIPSSTSCLSAISRISAVRRTDSWARSLAISSGPIPAGSPNTIAIRGFTLCCLGFRRHLLLPGDTLLQHSRVFDGRSSGHHLRQTARAIQHMHFRGVTCRDGITVLNFHRDPCMLFAQLPCQLSTALVLSPRSPYI